MCEYKLAFFTNDSKLAAELIDWLKDKQAAEDSSLLVVDYNERDRAIECLASEVGVDIEDPDNPFIDDPEFGDSLMEEIAEAALEQAKNGD
ncbi:MAG: hypothetical protein DWQ19_09495 [Crenarchaeota archaeon]|nr:MAG: hypothetical protein DWQ19_09495 [Thermoproteota archaeon]